MSVRKLACPNKFSQRAAGVENAQNAIYQRLCFLQPAKEESLRLY